MDLIKVTATRRQENGKGASSRLRREGLIPAVAYGKNITAQALAVSPAAVIKVLVSDLGVNSVLELDVEGKDKITALIRDYQYHPLSRQLLHADFQQIKLDEPVDVEVPLELTGKAAGIVLGGIAPPGVPHAARALLARQDPGQGRLRRDRARPRRARGVEPDRVARGRDFAPARGADGDLDLHREGARRRRDGGAWRGCRCWCGSGRWRGSGRGGSSGEGREEEEVTRTGALRKGLVSSSSV